MPISTKRFIQWIVLVCTGAAGLVSLATGVRHALQHQSHDLQWRGGYLLSRHIDPWAEKLANYPHHTSHFSPPNYLHLLYVLWLPFSGLSFHAAEILWCAVSIAFSLGAVWLLARLFELTRSEALILLFLLWMSAPFRVVLEVGQMSLFELFFFTLAYAALSTWVAGTAFGVSLVKYSFSPAAVILLALRLRVRLLLVAAAMVVLGLLAAWLLLPTPLAQLAREPFLVSRVAVNPGLADLMTTSEFVLGRVITVDHARLASYGLGLAGSALYALLLSRFRLTRAAELTLLSLAALFFFKHLVYDYVFLVIPLAFCFSLKRLRTASPIAAGVLVFWFLATFLSRASNDFTVNVWGLLVNFFLLTALLTYTTFVVLRQARGAGEPDAEPESGMPRHPGTA